MGRTNNPTTSNACTSPAGQHNAATGTAEASASNGAPVATPEQGLAAAWWNPKFRPDPYALFSDDMLRYQALKNREWHRTWRRVAYALLAAPGGSSIPGAWKWLGSMMGA